MNEQQITDVLKAVASVNGRYPEMIPETAYRVHLADMDYAEVMAKLVDLAATVTWITPAHLISDPSKPKEGKNDRAVLAWQKAKKLSAGRGMLGLLRERHEVIWDDPLIPKALVEARHSIRNDTEDNARWTFIHAYNALAAELEPAGPALEAGTNQGNVIPMVGRRLGSLDQIDRR